MPVLGSPRGELGDAGLDQVAVDLSSAKASMLPPTASRAKVAICCDSTCTSVAW